MEEKFFSSVSRLLINFWQEVINLIGEYVFIGEDYHANPRKFSTTFSSKQINIALDNSSGLIANVLNTYVARQKLLNNIDENEKNLDARNKELQQLLDSGAELKDLEDFYRKITGQREILGSLRTDVESWRNDLEAMLAIWNEEHKKNHQQAVETLISYLQTQGVKLTQSSIKELLYPSKDRAELLENLAGYYPAGLPKGWNKDDAILKLRVLWTIGTYNAIQRTGITDDKNLWKGLTKEANNVLKDLKQHSKKQQQDFGTVKQKLELIQQKIPKEEIITPKQKTQLQKQIKVQKKVGPAQRPAPEPE